MQLSLGFSPCPNDTFMFDALVNQKIDTNGLVFTTHIADVEELNQACLHHRLDVSKLSYHAYTYLSHEYQMLSAGSALGRGVGPLLITKMPYNLHDVERLKIAIPGKYTTAAFLLECAFPEAKNLIETSFENIEQWVLDGEVDAGVIIHENRFTYESKGLLKIIDLGEFWEQKMGLPIPLGGIAIKRDISEDIKIKVNELVESSVRYAFNNPESSQNFVKEFAQEMDTHVLSKHIETYVNPFSIDLGAEGKQAVRRMFQEKHNDGSTMNLEKLFVR